MRVGAAAAIVGAVAGVEGEAPCPPISAAAASQAGLVAVEHPDRGARLGERRGDALADAAGGAGDDGDLPLDAEPVGHAALARCRPVM